MDFEVEPEHRVFVTLLFLLLFLFGLRLVFSRCFCDCCRGWSMEEAEEEEAKDAEEAAADNVFLFFLVV